MVKKSNDIWPEILENQKLALIGTNEPNKGNGYHDRISFELDNRYYPPELYDRIRHELYSIYLHSIESSIEYTLGKMKLGKGLRILNCSDNYLKTLIKYTGHHHYRDMDLHDLFSNWAKSLTIDGRVIIEFIGWYGNNSHQLYGFELQNLHVEYCKINSTEILYKVPAEIPNAENKWQEVKIPLSKCIAINFPSELGGYDGFSKVVSQALNLGNKYSIHTRDNPERFHSMKEWDKQFNKIISSWGYYPGSLDAPLNSFYKGCLAFRHKETIAYCTLSLINGLKQLIALLNVKLNESASIEFDLPKFSISEIHEMKNKWMDGSVSFEEVNKFLYY